MKRIPAAVAAYIGCAIWFTSSGSLVNPAGTIRRAFSDSFAGIAPQSLPAFVVAQLAGGAAGLALAGLLYGGTGRRTARRTGRGAGRKAEGGMGEAPAARPPYEAVS
ncbi:hypothetical protein [Streptomyces sp. BR123]|uniref:hypothetical protein n=1 Tax=Streptomyces sp. BR123 TaxID=2749828 RepID=UPI0027BA4736|nr:hypothetical protein [Streptomyces sp. BR123]